MACIVIVDDDEIVTGIVTSVLENSGHIVVAVHDGDAAVATVLECTPDLLILDQALPGLSGMHILTHLRKLPLGVDLPIMMLTGRGSRLHIELADQGGADDYITKPFDAADLSARVNALLKGADISRSARATEAESPSSDAHDDRATPSD